MAFTHKETKKQKKGQQVSVNQREHLSTAGGDVNWYSHDRKHYGVLNIITFNLEILQVK